MFGLFDMVLRDTFVKGTKILAIHTGGIQGIEGINKKLMSEQQQIINVI